MSTQSGDTHPTIVLVHGAWADASGFAAEIRALQELGGDLPAAAEAYAEAARRATVVAERDHLVRQAARARAAASSSRSA